MRIQKTFIGSKYQSLFVSSTVLMVLTAAMGTVDTLLAGIFLGEDAVAGVCLVLPIYTLASFFSVCFSYGVPILYAGKIGDTVRLVTKDNGKITDLTDTNRDVSSLRAYALSSLLEAHTTHRAHFLALSFNHNVLEIQENPAR